MCTPVPFRSHDPGLKDDTEEEGECLLGGHLWQRGENLQLFLLQTRRGERRPGSGVPQVTRMSGRWSSGHPGSIATVAILSRDATSVGPCGPARSGWPAGRWAVVPAMLICNQGPKCGSGQLGAWNLKSRCR